MASAVNQFMSITGVSEEEASAFLEAFNGNLETAVEQYFESGLEAANSRGHNESKKRTQASRALEDDDDDDDEMYSDFQPEESFPDQRSNSFTPTTPSQSSTSDSSKKTTGSSSSRFRTLNDLRSSGQDDQPEDRGGQEFFAGGGKSGVAVQGPAQQNDPKSRTVAAIGGLLKTAQETAQREQQEGAPARQQGQQPTTFHGAGYRLGEDLNKPTEVVGNSQSANNQPDDAQNHTLIFWRNGFSIDDGPLRPYTDPENVQFLEEVNKGRVPAELRARAGQPVNIFLQQKTNEDYSPPPKVLKPFSGQGNRLGSIDEPPTQSHSYASSSTTSSSSSSSSVPPPPSASAVSTPSSASASLVSLNESEPITSVQLRLADGTRLVARFNHTHTVADIRNFVDKSKPNTRSYVLMTTFPPKELNDHSQTIASAGLMNAVIVQRFK